MDPWIQQIAGQGITALLLTAALAWQTRKLAAAEEELKALRAKCEAELKAERDKREALESKNSMVILKLGTLTTEAMKSVAAKLPPYRG